MQLSSTAALGRVLEAARIMAGLDQAALGKEAGVAGSTVSNVENGHDARDETVKTIRRTLRKKGVSITFDTQNGLASVAIVFTEPEDEDE